jgi:hypothetical protein
VIASSETGVVVSLSWRTPPAPELLHQFQALRLRDGKIFDMQDHRDRRAALRAVQA